MIFSRVLGTGAEPLGLVESVPSSVIGAGRSRLRFLRGYMMRTIKGWSWAFGSKIRGQVDGESFCSLPVIGVDVEKGVVEVKGGESFRLEDKSAEEPLSLDDIRAIVSVRYAGGVR